MRKKEVQSDPRAIYTYAEVATAFFPRTFFGGAGFFSFWAATRAEARATAAYERMFSQHVYITSILNESRRKVKG